MFLLILLTIGFTQFIIKETINNIEERLTLDDIKKLKHILNLERQSLLGLTKDWASWTDAWLFMQGKNPSFPENNITPETFTNNKINLLAYFDLKGKIKGGSEYYNKSKKLLPVNEEFWSKYIQKALSLYDKLDLKEQGLTGISFKDDKPIIVAVHPVLRSDFKGPYTGFLIMVRFITEEYKENIKYLLDLKEITIEKLKENRDYKKQNLVIRQELENFSVFYTEEDFFGNPIVYFSFQKEKTLWAMVKINVLKLSVFYLLSFLIFGIIFWHFTKKHILNKIEGLIKDLNQIKAGQKNEINTCSKDEIGFLCNEINKYIQTVKIQIEEIERNRKIYETIAENSESLIFLFESSGDVLFANAKAKEMLMKEPEKTQPQYLFNLLNDIVKLNDGEKTFLSEFKLNGGFYVNGLIIPLSEGKLLFIAQDITHLKREKEKLLEKASKDSLTSLYNRTFFENSVRKIFNKIKQGDLYSLLFIDLDNLKLVNDKFGHVIGDEVIKETANAIKRSTREEDLAVRWGGDEFLVVIKGNTEIAKTIAERIQKNIGKIKLSILPETIEPTVSIGITAIDIKKDIENSIKEADMAVYDAKKEGKNKIKVFLS